MGRMLRIRTDQGPLVAKHHDVTERVIRVFYDVYNELGSGFVESVYREAMRLALTQAGLRVGVEVPIQVGFRGEVIGSFRADLIVNDVVLLELKTCESLSQRHEAQTMNYLRATNVEVALLMNFGPEPKFRRMLLDNDKKKSVPSVPIRVKPSLPEAN
jgi:GxxExxY protein